MASEMVVCSTRHIPSEVSCEIFSHLSSPLRLLEPYKFPWYLGQVCSKWRAIFLSMQPYFWNEIQIERPEDRGLQPDSADVMAMLTFFLNVTSGAPFSFTLYKEKYYYVNEAPAVQLILSKLRDCSMQWVNASMELRVPEFFLLRSVKNRVPLLKSLELILPIHLETKTSNHDSTLLLQMGKLFENAPLLTRIKLYCLSDLGWRFNWALLTSIHLSSFSDSPQLVINILRQAINLEEFSLNDTKPFHADWENIGDTAIIKLPRLKYLSVRESFFLTILETPALEELKISFKEGNSDIARIMIEFLLRSNCDLSRLTSRDIKLPVLTEILSYTPNLEKLLLWHDEFLVDLVKWLARSESGTNETEPQGLPLRRLHSLSLNCWSEIEGNDLEAVQEMVTYRDSMIDKSVEGLRELVIYTDLSWRGSSAVLKSLESLCKDKRIDFRFIRSFNPKDFKVIQLPISVEQKSRAAKIVKPLNVQGLTIPADIVREIFSHLSSLLPVLEAYKFPWYLGQICSKWRAIFMSMQRDFWSEIQIEKLKSCPRLIMPQSANETETERPEDHNGQTDTGRTMAMLDFFLAATHGAPFSFDLYVEEPYRTENVSYVRLVLSKLVDHSMQWKDVSMQMQLPEVLLLCSVKNRLPVLQSLDLYLPYHDEMERPDHDDTLFSQVADVFEDTPQLTRLELRCLSDVPCRFNWALLTDLHLDWPDDPQIIITTLQQTVNLVALTISGKFDFESVGNTNIIIKLPHLECLSTKGLFLFTILETPELGELEFELTTSNPNNAGIIIDFLHRSKCELSRLSWKQRANAPGALKGVLPYMPYLEELSLDGVFSFGMLKWLAGTQSTADATQPRQLPLQLLDSLSISYSRLGDKHLKALQEMIINRNSTADASVEGLQELKLGTKNVWDGPSDDALESLESLCETMGIEFDFVEAEHISFEQE
ncbi:hypothetical protein F5887DRAFT_1217923 [Amanita rubescens]|nr:hypothetical protein F5887DRAFT_1217923 [Amanita rubescens]